jgi:hypothetical protein
MGYELNSKLSPKYYASVADAGIRFLVNETKSPITYPLTGSYVSAKNFSYSGSITLQPFTSEVLLYGSGGVPPTDPPVDPPPPPPPPDPNPPPVPGAIRVPTKYIIIHVNPLP